MSLQRIEAVGTLVDTEIEKKYSNDSKRKKAAYHANRYVQEYLRNCPKGFNFNQNSSEYKENLRNYVTGRMTGEIPSPNNAKEFVFLGFLAMAVISGIVSWVVKKFLDRWFS